MKILAILSLLVASSFAKEYKDCNNCRVITVDKGVEWGVQHKDWCLINAEFCDEKAEKNQCFSFPKYLCCEGCSVVTEDATGKWGIEHGQWCGIKDECFAEVEPELTEVPEEEEEIEITETIEEETEDSECSEEETITEYVTDEAEVEERDCLPRITDKMYTADPAPLVVGDTLYLYTTHDEDVLIDNFYTMRNWHVFSTKDMVNWTHHGEILSLDDEKDKKGKVIKKGIPWAEDRAWAPQCIERNGKYYFYFPAQLNDHGGMGIGVAVADSPIGPFEELGEPLVFEDDWVDFDPTVFIDDDGQAYLYFGNPVLRYVKLNEDMISYDEELGVQHVIMTREGFGVGNDSNGEVDKVIKEHGEPHEYTTYGEGPYLYKRNGIYYMIFAGFRRGKPIEYIGYSTSDKPTGPWKYQGPLMTEEGGVFTVHPAVTEFNGKNYLFYHNGDLNGGGDFHRNVAFTEFEFNEDGTVDPIKKCAKP